MSNRPYYHVNAVGREAIETDPERFGSLNDAEAEYNVAKLSGKATQLRDEWFAAEQVVGATAGSAVVYTERQSDSPVTPTHWIRGMSSTALSVDAASVEQDDVSTTPRAGWTPASLFGGVYYLCDAE